MKASDYFAKFIHKIGVERVYTLSGGMIAPLLDAIGEHPGIRLIPVSHEQTAGFAAETEGRLAQRPGIALGTNGPGALNLVTGIASAYSDGVPSIFVGGQVQTYISNLVPGGRQSGLQQCDFRAVCQAISKEVIAPTTAREVPHALARAFETSMNGRRGPVVLDMPLDVQMAETQTDTVYVPDLAPRASPDALRRLADTLRAADRPVILAGGGVRGAEDACRRLAIRHGLPVVSTIAALDVSAGLGVLGVGMCGMYGTRAANTILTEADVVLVLGSRVDHAVLGADPAAFARKRRVWQVDIDPAEAGSRMKPSEILVADAAVTLAQMEGLQSISSYRVPEAWSKRVNSVIATFPTTAERAKVKGIDPNCFMADLARYSYGASAYVVDAGHHTWFAAQSLVLQTNQRFISSTGLHACGTAIPAAVATALHFRRPVVAIVGDGSVQLNIQDLATVTREALPIKTVIMNNSAHGSVRQLQSEISAGRYHAAVWGLATVDHSAVFAAYGVPSRRIVSPDEVEDALEWLWKTPEQAQMLDVVFDTAIDVSPVVPFGRQLSAMLPKVQGGCR